MNKKELYKAILLSPFDMFVAIPLVMGVILLLLTWVELMKGAAIAFIGSLLLIGAIGLYVQRLMFGWKKTQEKILSKWKADKENARDSELDDLHYRLRYDGDDRTQGLLSDLRKLTQTLKETYDSNKGLSSSSAMGVMSDVGNLFDTAVCYLKESLSLLETSNGINNKKVKEKTLQKRESLILEVQQSLEYLGEVLVQLQDVSFDSSRDQKLKGIRDGIAERLEAVESVSREINSWEGTGSSERRNKYLAKANETE